MLLEREVLVPELLTVAEGLLVEDVVLVTVLLPEVWRPADDELATLLAELVALDTELRPVVELRPTELLLLTELLVPTPLR